MQSEFSVPLDCSSILEYFYLDKESLIQQLVYEFQNSGLCDQFDAFSLSLGNLKFSDVEFSLQLSTTHPILPHVESFLLLCNKANNAVDEFICNLQNVLGTDNLLSNCFEDRRELQLIICSIFVPSTICIRLKPLLESILCLELEFAEMNVGQHIFSSVVPSQFENHKRAVVDKLRSVIHCLRWLSLDRIISPILLSYAKSALINRIRLLCSDNYSEQLLDAIIQYKNRVMQKTWISEVLSDKSFQSTLSHQLSDKLVYHSFYEVRKPDIFSLIIEFPDSMGALVDLGKCVEQIPLRESLISHLTEGVKQRLLHPGVHTEQILVAYSYLVRALRIVDKSHLVQDVVCRPVSLYLRQREDAVRCIVDKLLANPEQDGETDEMKVDEVGSSSAELYSELLLRKPLEVEPADGAEDSDSEVVFEDPDFDDEAQVGEEYVPGSLPGWGSSWQPDPIEAIYQGGQWRRRMDLLSMLVSIYGSKKAFLVEYKQLLSQRLLKQRSFNIAHELRNLELLKLRFGEQNLVECEVMLKDIRDSKRITSLVSETNRLPVPSLPLSDSQSKPEALVILRPRPGSAQPENKSVDVDTKDLFPLSAFILSLHYWPELIDEKFKLPEGLQNTFNNYECVFQRLKGNRTLQWMHKLGMVNIELELDDKCIQLDVTPIQASMIYMFTKKRLWSARDLAQELETQISVVRAGLLAFVQLGFLRTHGSTFCGTDSHQIDAQSDVYEVCTTVSGTTKRGSTLHTPTTKTLLTTTSDNWLFHRNDEEEAFVCSTRDKKEKELQMFWSYIVAMLTNLGGLSLDRIHSMLRMFALGSTSNLECNREELLHFLESKIRDSELIYDGEVYKLSKSDV